MRATRATTRHSPSRRELLAPTDAAAVPRSTGLPVVRVLEFGVHDIATLRLGRSPRPRGGAARGLAVHRLGKGLGDAREALLSPPDPFGILPLQRFPGFVERLLDRPAVGLGELRAVLGEGALG